MTKESRDRINQASTSTTNYTATHINYFIIQLNSTMVMEIRMATHLAIID